MNKKKSEKKPLQRGKNGIRQKSVLGPVPSLEEHVHPDWWRYIFNSLYLKTDGDVVNDQNITSKEMNFSLDILKPSLDDVILDLCCGHGRHSLELARRNFTNVHGLDRSHYLIQRAKTQARKESLDIRFREGDARKIPYSPDTFDIVLVMGNSFGYFEAVKDDLNVLRQIFQVLKPWGKILIDVSDGEFLKDNFQPRSWEWIDKKHFVCRERSLSLDKQRLISREVITHTDKGVIADQFYAERLYTRENLRELFETVGFSDLTLYEGITSDSQRNQDLGMMERRIIAMATVKKEWTPVKRKIKAAKNVVVIFGDPRKPDPLKPLAVFDDDDFYTIDQLKKALREIKGYQFSYLDNHNTLIQDLLRIKGKVDFIFNLCDEGYNNIAQKELHVPALLELTEIPYTGSGPQCLAYCYDKSLTRGIAEEMKIPVPKAFFIKPEETTFNLPFSFPVIVKPNFGDSSFGITKRSVTNNIEELVNAISEIREKFGYDKPILVEEFLTGKDLSVGIIGNPPESYNVLPIIEADFSALPEGFPRICGYESKWNPDSPYWNIKSVHADLPKDTKQSIIEWCIELFKRLECLDYVRFDWRLDAKGHPRLLEVNPNPGWCWDGHLAKMANIRGLSYKEMLKAILRATEERLLIQMNHKTEERTSK